MLHDAIAVIDFGGQYAHLIATKVRRQRVLAEIRQPEDPIEDFAKYRGIILSGSPSLSALGQDSEYNKAIYDLDIPILGFCFGHQEIAKHYGGAVTHGHQEWGQADLHITQPHPLFKGLAPLEQVLMSHFDSVVSVGESFVELGYSVLGKSGQPHRYAAIGSDKYRRYGFQYHPEVDDTLHGDQMIGNFVREICGCRPTWTMERYFEEQIEKIQQQVGSRSVFLLASGGVDSTVAACLFRQALSPSQLHLLHIDSGLMRKDESAQVLDSFKTMGLDANLHFVDASQDFLRALTGLVEPEEKRRAIGNTFVAVFEREAKRLGLENHLLGQGTIYPDTIETGGTKRANTIKTHHNRVPLIARMMAEGKVIEPLVDLYKTEVRELGETLSIRSDMIWRHPFPGPGLGIRLLCSQGAAEAGAAELDAMSTSASGLLAPFGLQAQALPVKSVGVKADLRSYEHPVLVHGQAAWEVLQEASGLLFKTVSGINRCVWNLAERMPKVLTPLAATVTAERLALLREVDQLVTDGLHRHRVYSSIWQCPVVFVPLEIDGRGQELCVLRPINSERGMTATAAMLPPALIAELSEAILKLPRISGLVYDLTSKPPGTVEWE